MQSPVWFDPRRARVCPGEQPAELHQYLNPFKFAAPVPAIP